MFTVQAPHRARRNTRDQGISSTNGFQPASTFWLVYRYVDVLPGEHFLGTMLEASTHQLRPLGIRWLEADKRQPPLPCISTGALAKP